MDRNVKFCEMKQNKNKQTKSDWKTILGIQKMVLFYVCVCKKCPIFLNSLDKNKQTNNANDE